MGARHRRRIDYFFMSLAENNLLHVLHVLGAIVMVGAVLVALVAPAEAKKKTLLWGGIASLVVVLTGVRLWQGVYHFSGYWPVAKIVCWLGLSALVGVAFRRREAAGVLRIVALGLAALALYLVYFRPF